jgi:hypothetical protein
MEKDKKFIKAWVEFNPKPATNVSNYQGFFEGYSEDEVEENAKKNFKRVNADVEFHNYEIKITY